MIVIVVVAAAAAAAAVAAEYGASSYTFIYCLSQIADGVDFPSTEDAALYVTLAPQVRLLTFNDRTQCVCKG